MSFTLLGILNSQIDAAGGAAYELLETQILTTAAASVTFAGLGSHSDYKHLQVRYTARTSDADTDRDMFLEFNSDSGVKYARHMLEGNGSSVSSSAATSQPRIPMNTAISGANAAANIFGAGVVDMLDAFSSTKNTTTRSLYSAMSVTRLFFHSGLYNETAALTQIKFTPQVGNFITGSRFSLYGIRG